MSTTHGRRRRSFYKLPNRLILDGALSYSARRIGSVLYSRRNPLGACRRSLASLAKLTGCSVTTARKALGELEDRGYITRCRHYVYSESQGRLVYDQYTYHCDLGFQGGFTLVPRDFIGHPLKSSAFVLCLYMYLQAGNGTRAFPSLRRIASDLWMGKATVCRAIKALGAAGRIYVQACIRVNRTFSNNSYFLLSCDSVSVTLSAAPERPVSSRRVPGIVMPIWLLRGGLVSPRTSRRFLLLLTRIIILRPLVIQDFSRFRGSLKINKPI